jgi:hypothetical protein
MQTKAALLKAATPSGMVAEPFQASLLAPGGLPPARQSAKTAFTKRQYAIAVEGLRSEGVPIDALSTARVAERCLEWMDRQRMQAREKPSLASGKRHLPDILGRAVGQPGSRSL